MDLDCVTPKWTNTLICALPPRLWQTIAFELPTGKKKLKNDVLRSPTNAPSHATSTTGLCLRVQSTTAQRGHRALLFHDAKLSRCSEGHTRHCYMLSGSSQRHRDLHDGRDTTRECMLIIIQRNNTGQCQKLKVFLSFLWSGQTGTHRKQGVSVPQSNALMIRRDNVSVMPGACNVFTEGI